MTSRFAFAERWESPASFVVGVLIVAAGFAWQHHAQATAASGLPGLTAEESGGALIVTSVRDQSSAERAGIAAGDQILAIDGQPLRHLTEASHLFSHAPEAKVRISVLHARERRDVMVDRLES